MLRSGTGGSFFGEDSPGDSIYTHFDSPLNQCFSDFPIQNNHPGVLGTLASELVVLRYSLDFYSDQLPGFTEAAGLDLE